jgi:hypothetical protein
MTARPGKFRSRRPDGRGHWPRGKRLHPDAPIGAWPSVSALARAVIAWAAQARRSPDMAGFCRTSRKTLWRWRHHDIPGPRFATRLLKWAARQGIKP